MDNFEKEILESLRPELKPCKWWQKHSFGPWGIKMKDSWRDVQYRQCSRCGLIERRVI